MPFWRPTPYSIHVHGSFLDANDDGEMSLDGVSPLEAPPQQPLSPPKARATGPVTVASPPTETVMVTGGAHGSPSGKVVDREECRATGRAGALQEQGAEEGREAAFYGARHKLPLPEAIPTEVGMILQEEGEREGGGGRFASAERFATPLRSSAARIPFSAVASPADAFVLDQIYEKGGQHRPAGECAAPSFSTASVDASSPSFPDALRREEDSNRVPTSAATVTSQLFASPCDSVRREGSAYRLFGLPDADRGTVTPPMSSRVNVLQAHQRPAEVDERDLELTGGRILALAEPKKDDERDGVTRTAGGTAREMWDGGGGDGGGAGICDGSAGDADALENLLQDTNKATSDSGDLAIDDSDRNNIVVVACSGAVADDDHHRDGTPATARHITAPNVLSSSDHLRGSDVGTAPNCNDRFGTAGKSTSSPRVKLGARVTVKHGNAGSCGRGPSSERRASSPGIVEEAQPRAKHDVCNGGDGRSYGKATASLSLARNDASSLRSLRSPDRLVARDERGWKEEGGIGPHTAGLGRHHRSVLDELEVREKTRNNLLGGISAWSYIRCCANMMCLVHVEDPGAY